MCRCQNASLRCRHSVPSQMSCLPQSSNAAHGAEGDHPYTPAAARRNAPSSAWTPRPLRCPALRAGRRSQRRSQPRNRSRSAPPCGCPSRRAGDRRPSPTDFRSFPSAAAADSGGSAPVPKDHFGPSAPVPSIPPSRQCPPDDKRPGSGSSATT